MSTCEQSLKEKKTEPLVKLNSLRVKIKIYFDDFSNCKNLEIIQNFIL